MHRFLASVRGSRFGGFALLLVLCASLVAASAQEQPQTKGDASGKPPSAATSLIHFERPVVFTMALGGPDVGANARIAVALAGRLHENGKAGLGPIRNALIVPEAQWTIAEYLQQCAQDPNTLGAFIVLPPSLSNSVDNYIVLLRNKTEVALSLMIAKCTHEAGAPGVAAKVPSPGDNAAVVWASFAERGVSGRSQVEFFPLAILTSVYLALSPQRTTQTTTTTVYPVTTPIPAAGERSQVQTLTSSILNAQGTAQLQQGVLTAFSATGGPGATIGAANAPEKQTYHAADDALQHVVIKQLNAECGGRTADPLRVFCSW